MPLKHTRMRARTHTHFFLYIGINLLFSLRKYFLNPTYNPTFCFLPNLNLSKHDFYNLFEIQHSCYTSVIGIAIRNEKFYKRSH